ncbi:MAG: DUF3313 domain-containing protein [Candidatus Binataceae bacterium]
MKHADGYEVSARKTLRASAPFAALAIAVLSAAALSGCGTVSTQVPVSLTQETASGQTVPSAASDFLGSDASLLQPGSEGEANYRYIAPNVQWSSYTSVLIQPVQYWDSADSSVSQQDQQMLTAYLYNVLKQSAEKNFTIVDKPGPGTISIQAAIINATAATPGLRTISVVIPQARILNYGQSLATGHAAFSGSAEVAVKFTDSVSGQLLGESVDKRQGGMAVSQAAQVEWGDAESAMDAWGKLITDRAAQLGAGHPQAASPSTSGS